jgi:hypothetical protein
VILEKSHSSTTTGHFAFTTHPHPFHIGGSRLRGVAVAMLGVVLGIFVALIYVDRGPIVRGLAAIGFI